MKKPLRCLVVEDSDDDCFLLVQALTAGGYDVHHAQVQTPAEMAAALTDGVWDVVLSDYSMPSFSALAALRLLQRTGRDLPFIIISGTTGEETAVAMLKAGAHDFLLKSQMARFVPVLEREVREAESRRDKRLAEESLRDSEQKYRQIVETAQEGIWVIDGEGRTTFTNLRMARMLGAEPKSLHGASLFEFLVDEQGLLDATTRITRFKRRDGSEFWASMSTNPIPAPGGAGRGAIAMVTDITEQKQLQEQLMISDRMASVGTLAAGVAHEINNPLAVVFANLDLTTQQVEALRIQRPELTVLMEVQEGIRDGLEAASRVRDVVNDLKVFSRGEADLRRPVDVQQVIETSLRMAANETRHRCTVIRDFHAIPLVDANASRLGQVFLNLIANAAQAIEEGGATTKEIRISTRLDPTGLVLVECRDTGAGIPPEILRRLFTPFFTTKAVGVGTGLGLSISHRIVTSLGGRITVASEVGKGSVFQVFLPASSGPSAAQAAPGQLPAPAPAPGRSKILVVDDEPMLLTVLRKSLSQQHDVITTESPKNALSQIVTGNRFDLILCDLMMPLMTGMDLYAAILDKVPDQAKRIVFLTGGAFTPSAQAFLDHVPNLRVAKPFNLTSLRMLVADRLAELAGPSA